MSITTSSHAIVGTPLRPLRRGRDNCILGGVCGGFATRLGIKERNIRVVFALLTLLFGFGVLLYMTFWLVLTRSGEEHSIIQQIFLNRREAQLVLVAFIATIVLIITLESTGTHASEGFGWPLLLSAFAGFAVWRGASIDERNHLNEFFNTAPFIGGAFSKSRKGLVLRVVAGGALIFVGLHQLHHLGGFWGSAGSAIIGTAVLVFGVLVLFAPWWLQNVRELTSERRERVRVEERASMVAHLHDSVLQTLTLIERAAANEADVVRLARNQERELRHRRRLRARRAHHDARGRRSRGRDQCREMVRGGQRLDLHRSRAGHDFAVRSRPRHRIRPGRDPGRSTGRRAFDSSPHESTRR